MMKKICTACGRLYDIGTSCNCRQSQRRKTQQRKKYDVETRSTEAKVYYHSSRWQTLSEHVKKRSGYTDTLQAFLAILIRRGCLLHYIQNQSTDAGKTIVKTLAGLLVADNGTPIRFQFRRIQLVVHHIIPRDDDKSREYDVDNLIAVLPIVHNLIHDYYDDSAASKDAMQRVLFDAVKYFNDLTR